MRRTSDIVLVAVISLLGTLGGSFGGILVANKLVNYRLQQLETKVDRHNGMIERTFKLEERCAVIETRLDDAE
ncbi:hypothetical protein SDC9_181068 [bioreactor metagenome]|uniref:Uncharacterized protein n=1 Tax=bioreactor metagenome TaxID=1076179 RepID=A0A645H678_9ZZZZ